MTGRESATRAITRLAWAATLTALAIGCAGRIDPGLATTPSETIQLGPRPFYLLDRLAPGPLRDRLETCREGPFRRSRFSIGHRGAPLQFPEHTRESYLAAIRMGAGVVECDVTPTRDGELVCRHSACDLATTTNILETPLAERCREGFEPARFDEESGELSLPARARCCASDLTLAEFRTLEGRMDASNPRASTLAEFLAGTPGWRTDLYANGGQLMSHDDSLELFRAHGVAMTPELKKLEPPLPVDTVPTPSESGRRSADQRDVAQQLVDAYRDAGIPPGDVALQSFDPADIRTWLEVAPDYAAHAIWLVEHDPRWPAPSRAEFEARFAEGFRTIAPPISALLSVDAEGAIRASDYARNARTAGLEIVAWTAERSGRIRNGLVEDGEDDFYLGPVQSGLADDGDVYRVIDALVHEVGIRALFSDWPATTTYYANCLGLE